MAAAALKRQGQCAGSVGCAVAASAEGRRQRSSKVAMVGSAATALAARVDGGRVEDNAGDSNGG